MRNKLKVNTLEDKFPILSVENDCIISKQGEITLGFKLHLPSIFTVSKDGYETIHSTLCKAIKILPNFCVVHKQDWYLAEKYKSKTVDDELTFLSDAYERHFNERPYLNHYSFLYITKTTKERNRQQSSFNTLCRPFIVPREVNRDSISVFMDCVEQFASIINECPYLRLERLRNNEIIGEGNGIFDKYFSLSMEDTKVLKDISISHKDMKIGDNILFTHTLSDLDDIPNWLSTDIRYEAYSTDKSSCKLSFASPVGLFLNCNHIYNQYIFIDDSNENLKNFERKARNMQSLSRYSRANSINKEWIDLYLNSAHSNNLLSVRCHANIMAWAENENELKNIKKQIGSQIALMECVPRYATVDTPVLYWSGIPGNSGDFPSEETFYTFLEQACTLFTLETCYKDSLSHFGIRMCDRLSMKPIHLDISDLPMKLGLTTNRNKFCLGPSGSGKSFIINHLVRQYYEQGTHVVMVDVGNSYFGLCELIRSKTGGEDGIYMTYTEENPISFNPFYSENNYFDIEKKESIKTLLLTLWKTDYELPSRSEEVNLSNAVNLFIEKMKTNEVTERNFNAFYDFLKDEYRQIVREKNIREKDFDLENFLNVLEPFYAGGEYDYLLNSDKQIDLVNKRFVVFELDNIKDHKILFPVTTIIIMETFLSKIRQLKGIRKMIVIEEAWKAIAKNNMAEYIKYLFKTVRKHFGEALIITQEVDDVISSEIVKDTIINNSDCKILLDQRKYMNKFDSIQKLLGLTNKQKDQILSINLDNKPSLRYKEVWIGLGNDYSAVYATEVSMEEYLTYTTEESEKLEVYKLAEKLGGNIELAIKELAKIKKQNLLN